MHQLSFFLLSWPFVDPFVLSCLPLCLCFPPSSALFHHCACGGWVTNFYFRRSRRPPA
ncbi:hypothetical protein V8C34DRAFT_294930 [Trichoderma compactum]